jgi:hypothetical protein
MSISSPSPDGADEGLGVDRVNVFVFVFGVVELFAPLFAVTFELATDAT